MEEKSIMPVDYFYRTERFPGSHRHEVFGGSNRKYSIEDGLIIFLTPELHNMSDKGIHFDKGFDERVKVKAQKAWMRYYNKTEDDFRKRYGKSWL